MTRSRWPELFGVDLRSLALFRIALGAVLLVELVRRIADFTAFYTEAGVLPLDALRMIEPRAGWYSLHVLLGGSPLAVASLFALAAVAAIALGVGWHTRTAAVVAWLLLVSVQRREPWLSYSGGDHMLRLYLFWGIFLPLGARLSLDALRNPALRSVPPLHVSAATVALLGQVCLVYFATGLLKSGELWVDGTAVRYSLEIDPYVTDFGAWLRDGAAPLLPLATHATRWFERLGPLLAFSPIATGPLRTLTVAAFFVFHLSLAAALDIGLFPAASMVGWLAFLPAWFWDVLLRRPERVSLGGATPVRLAPAWPVQAVVGALFAWVALQVITATLGLGDPFPRPIRAVGNVLKLGQHWSMFSPNPNVEDTWIERIGETPGGERFEVARDAPAVGKAERRSALESWSWRIWFGNLAALPPGHPARERILDRLAAFSCAEWNAAHPEAQRFAAIEIVLALERTMPVGTAPVERYVLLRRPCDPP